MNANIGLRTRRLFLAVAFGASLVFVGGASHGSTMHHALITAASTSAQTSTATTGVNAKEVTWG